MLKTLLATVILPACSNLSANCDGTPPLHRRLTAKEIKLVQSIYLRVYMVVFTIRIDVHIKRAFLSFERAVVIYRRVLVTRAFDWLSIVFVNLVLSVKSDKDLV